MTTQTDPPAGVLQAVSAARLTGTTDAEWAVLLDRFDHETPRLEQLSTLVHGAGRLRLVVGSGETTAPVR